MPHLLSIVLFLPLVGAIALAFIPRERTDTIKTGALVVSLITFALSLMLLTRFNPAQDHEFYWNEQLRWIPSLGISYHIGVDGLGLVMVLLTTLLSVLAISGSFSSVEQNQKAYYIILLLLETGMLGVFVALDLILFYVFWEVMLVPMYFLIGVWGGPRRIYATFKFVLYTLVGSLLMLVAMVLLYIGALGPGNVTGTFDLNVILQSRLQDNLPDTLRLWVFLAFALAFAIKVPMFPFHTWLPDAHVEAPTAGSVILAGVLLKMGTYGFLRFLMPLFPDVMLRVAPTAMWLAVIGIVYGALVALVQTDVKKLVAYSSVSHLGFVVLGIFAMTQDGVQGAILQGINHGISTGALFLIVGMIYERRHTREIAAFGGLWKVLPIYTIFFLITMMSSVGLPGLNGFVGEFKILLGTWGASDWAGPMARWLTAIAATGVILGAVYMLWAFQRMMQGDLNREENRGLRDLSRREMLTLAPLIALMFLIGIAPNPLLDMFDQTTAKVLAPAQQAQAARRMQMGDFSPMIPPSAPLDPHTHETAPGGPTGVPRP